MDGGAAGGAERRDPARLAWDRAQAALERHDEGDARRWLERAHRLVPGDALVALTLGAHRLRCGDAAGARTLLQPLAPEIPAAAAVIASACLALGDHPGAAAALRQARRGGVATEALAALSKRAGQAVAPTRRQRTMQGFVAAAADGIEGWAWHPADPDRDPVVLLRGPGGARRCRLSEPADGVEALPALARPRRIAIGGAALERLGEPISITDRAGTHLLGSPVWRHRVPTPSRRARARTVPERRAVDVVVPVFGNRADTAACLEALFASVGPETVVHVVDDASPEPALRAELAALAASGRIRLHRHAENRGFPSAANTGLRAASGRDVVLLNSDAVVPPGWLERLREAAYSAAAVGTATPLSTDDSIVGCGQAGPDSRLDALARARNTGLVAALPVGVGFCLYVRRDCLDQVGPFREDLFAQGYGEESEFCLRARRCGWRHVAALDVVVAHRGGGSFGTGRTALRRRNQALIEQHYPDYAGLIAAHAAADPLRAARRRIAAGLWEAGRLRSGAILVSHGAGGGVDEVVRGRAAALRVQGIRPIVLLPAAGGCRVEGAPGLQYAVPGELGALAALLREDRPTHLEVHHMLGHQHALLGLAGSLGIPTEHWVHDASLFCPRIALIGRGRRYCGEPAVAGCERCVAALGSNLEQAIGPAALVARSASDLARSRRVVAPTADAARRIERHFPGVRAEIVAWEARADAPAGGRETADGETVRVCVVGAIGVEKGFDVLEACAADAAARGLPLEFVVVGHTEDDERLMAAGPVFVTGRYRPEEAVDLIRQQRAQLAFVPSIWPETWCFALSRAWEAGLRAVAFDLGAPAERIRATGWGHLLPLGLPAPRINDALGRLAPARARLQPLRVIRPDLHHA